MESQICTEGATRFEDLKQRDDLITELLTRHARQKKLTDEEKRVLEGWCEEFPENRELYEEFSDPKWIKGELARMKPAPLAAIWKDLNAYLDEIGAPDDRESKEWHDEKYQMTLMEWIGLQFTRLLKIPTLWKNRMIRIVKRSALKLFDSKKSR